MLADGECYADHFTWLDPIKVEKASSRNPSSLNSMTSVRGSHRKMRFHQLVQGLSLANDFRRNAITGIEQG